MEEKNNIVIYQLEDGKTKIDVKLEEELDRNSTCQNFRQVRKEGKRTVERKVKYYRIQSAKPIDAFLIHIFLQITAHV